MKRCSKCKRNLLETEFSKNSRTKDGLNWQCKYCVTPNIGIKKRIPRNVETQIRKEISVEEGIFDFMNTVYKRQMYSY